MSTYTIEHAKSGRAACKKCKVKIGKNEIRIGTHADLGDKTMSSWMHPLCFSVPRKYSSMSVGEFVDDHLTDNTVTNPKVLDDEEKRQEIIEQIETKAPKKKPEKKTEKKEQSDYIRAVKRNADELYGKLAEEEETSASSAKRMKLSDDDRAKAEAYNKFSKMSVGELGDILKYNKVVKTGTKEVVLTRVIDGYVYGRIGKCIVCKLGRPKIADDGSCIECKGFFDEDRGFRVSCGNTLPVDKVERFKPWYLEEPTQEQEDAIENEESGKPSGDTNSKETLPDSMIQAVKKIEWNLKGKENLKKAAKAMIDLCSSEDSPIDFPSDDAKAKMDIAMMINSNKKSPPLHVLNLIAEEYGFKKSNDENAKNDEKLIESMMTVKQNTQVYMALQELATLYTAEGNHNAASSYRKVGNAVKELDFVITTENAKGLGKGKTKVAGIGKGSADKIYELLATGKIQKLEEKRAANS